MLDPSLLNIDYVAKHVTANAKNLWQVALVAGIGIALAGACPGTTLAQIGAGYRDAIFTLLGELAGAVAFSYSQPWLARSLIGTGPKQIFTELAGIPF